MTTETMTVHSALCEIKTIGKRIEKTIKEFHPVSTKEQQSTKVDGISLNTFADEAKSNADRANDMIKRYIAIKAEINHYNATTSIEIGNNSYTIAQALWMKDYGSDYQKKLLRHCTRELMAAQEVIEDANGNQLTARAENAANANYGNRDKNNGDEYLKFIEAYKDRYQTVLVDPLNIKEMIQQLDDEITEFDTQIDAALQVANATHTITIEY